jgi:glutamate synthase (NADPH/NADH) small chain
VGKPTGFLEYSRELPQRRPVIERVNDWFEIYQDFPEPKIQQQGARCMDCGVPFCHTGCPVNNNIPNWNDLVYHGRWREAVRRLHATNNFPEFTGRICPAPCEAACVLGINQPAVAIKQIEKTIIDRAFAEGWIQPEPPEIETGKKIAIIGSGPAGLAAAQQLRRARHAVTVYEKADRVGGLLRYGIPNFKLEKHVVDRRVAQIEAEGVQFVTGAHVGVNVSIEQLRGEYDALVLAGGAEQPRDLRVPGRELKGIHFAMDFLQQQNRRNLGLSVAGEEILATGKHVVIIGGGDTGADCLGTSHRQKAKSVRQYEIMPMPPQERAPHTPWPLWPLQLRTESAHEEGGDRDWAVATTQFTGDAQGNVKQLHAVRIGPPPAFEPISGTEFFVEADLVLLAMGFTGPVRNGMIEQLGVILDPRGNVQTDANSMSSVPGVFAAGDMRRGQSLVVWAVAEGRKAATGVDAYLRAESRC